MFLLFFSSLSSGNVYNIYIYIYIYINNFLPFLTRDCRYFSGVWFYQIEQNSIISNCILFDIGITPTPKYIEQFKVDVDMLSFCLNPLL